MRSLLALAAVLAIAPLRPALADDDRAPATVQAAPTEASVPAPAAAPALVADATLKAAARIDGAHILLGDLFDNTGAHAGDEVAAAPAPGGNILLSSGWLVATAHDHGIVWHPPTPFSSIRVERTDIEVTGTDIAAKLAATMGVDRADRRVVLDNQLRLLAPTGATPDIGIDHLELSKETNRFSADIRVPADDPAATAVHITGRIDTMVDLPVLTHAMMPGDAIRRQDVTMTWVRLEQAPQNGVANPQDLVGKTPRRPLRANEPLRPLDVEQPILVKRNDLVMIVLERPGMYLTAEGKALGDGGEGNVIQVTNVQSNRTLDAVVLGSGRVAIRPPGVQQAAF